MSRRVPGWIDGKTWKLNDEAETVNNIFKLYLNNVGSPAIARQFNLSGVETLNPLSNKKDKKGNRQSTSWFPSNIYRLLRNRQVIGEYQPTVSEFNSDKGAYDFTPTGDPLKGCFTSRLDLGPPGLGSSRQFGVFLSLLSTAPFRSASSVFLFRNTVTK